MPAMEGEVNLVDHGETASKSTLDTVLDFEQHKVACSTSGGLHGGRGSIGVDLELAPGSGVPHGVPASQVGASYLDLLTSVTPHDFSQHTSGASYWNFSGYPGVQSNESSSDLDSDSCYHSSPNDFRRCHVDQEYSVPVSQTLVTIEENVASQYFLDEDNERFSFYGHVFKAIYV
uniref:Uncharacterized protein n=1 Tax=Arundo donax TaxID=35708 RepID=A0A0A8ZLY1_ARUDO